MIAKERVIEYLETQGIELPEWLIDQLLVIIGTVSECLDAHYTPDVVALIQLYLIVLIASSQYSKYVSSQRAPSGASQSFRYTDGAAWWRGITNMLGMLDTHGCTASLVPESPYNEPHAALYVGKSCGGF